MLPAFIEGTNTRLFYAAGCVRPALHTALLAQELLNKRSQAATVSLGLPLAAGDLVGTADDAAGRLRRSAGLSRSSETRSA